MNIFRRDPVKRYKDNAYLATRDALNTPFTPDVAGDVLARARRDAEARELREGEEVMVVKAIGYLAALQANLQLHEASSESPAPVTIRQLGAGIDLHELHGTEVLEVDAWRYEVGKQAAHAALGQAYVARLQDQNLN